MKLKAGEFMIVGGATEPNRQIFFLVRAEIPEQTAKTR